LEQGREVYAVPGNIDVPNCAGSNSLLQDGAIPVFSGWDVVKEYAHQWPSSVEKRPDIRVAQRAEPISSYLEADKKSIDNQATSTYSVLNSKDLSETEQTILAALERTPQPLDEVIAKLDISAGTVKMTLTKLSVKGIVVMHPGGRVSLK
jgi:DNA processing protein